MVLLIQDFHHRRLLPFILHQHAASAAHVFDNIDNFAEARRCAAGLCEAGEAKVGTAVVLENDKELDDERDGFHLEI
jgi:hypothetical protein